MSKIIITTDDSIDFLIYDLDKEETTYIAGKSEALDNPQLVKMGRGTYRPFGITQDKANIYIASNDKLGQFDKKTFEFKQLINAPLWVNTHQIHLDGDTLYTCNTAIDTIGVYNPDYQAQISINYMNVVEQKLQPKYADELDSRHVNTLFDTGPYMMFVRHNRNVVNSDFGFFDKRTQSPRILFSAGRCCHGIAIKENVLYTLSTATGDLLAVDLESKTTKNYPLVDPKVGFLRGLELLGDKLIIGCSANTKTGNGDQGAYLLVADIVNKHYVKKLPLDGVKIINDLKVLTDG